MRVLDDSFDALRSRDWALLAKCVAEDVHRTGPYLDVVVDGVRTEFPEVLLFEFDAGGSIRRADVCIEQRRGPGR
jgi:hypothetical protein